MPVGANGDAVNLGFVIPDAITCCGDCGFVIHSHVELQPAPVVRRATHEPTIAFRSASLARRPPFRR